MDIPYIIQMLQNKIGILNNAKSQAYSVGDMERLNALDKDLISTEGTMAQLNLLQAATLAANAANQDLASVVTAGVVAAQNKVLIPDDALASLSQYDISTYAADPLYIQKITDMLSSMPALENTSQIDAYIAKEVVGSPLTGQMVIDATTTYLVDIRLTMAIMELDSRFGTAGVGATTFNPGNVGNTGTETHTYDSWADGVAAVAGWLSRHRVVVPVVPTPAVMPELQPDPVVSVDDTVENPVSTTTPAIVPPVVPLPTPTLTASSTNPLAPTSATTTPVIDPPVIDMGNQNATSTATSTPTTFESTSTTTPPTVQATSTNPTTVTPPEIQFENQNATSTSTSTPEVNTDDSFNATSTNEISTSTQDISATNTQARRRTTKRIKV